MSVYGIMRYFLALCLLSVSIATSLSALKNRYIVTGAPGVGKTKLIQYLHNGGVPTVPEIFTDVHYAVQNDGVLQTLLSNPLCYVAYTIDRQIARENALNPAEVTFLDRCALECLFFAEYYKRPIIQELKRRVFWQERSYNKTVFVLEPLPKECYEQTEVRRESYEQSLRLHHFLVHKYQKRGFTVISVPVGTVEERACFVLEHVRAQASRLSA